MTLLPLDRNELFDRNVPGTTPVLNQMRVGIAGCGGLGSIAAVSLARAGLGYLILADYDRIELSNLNRQHYFVSDIGRYKTDALAEHLRAVNPRIRLTLHSCRLTPENLLNIYSTADLLIEAFDRAEDKIWLIETWSRGASSKPVIVGNGLAGYGRNHEIQITRTGNVYFCGDMTSQMSMGLCAPRVAIVANMQANLAVELLMDTRCHDHSE
ncbi:sulfur carrier protein ThiS adenylyltransferase ThiF [bacterium]|nr:sulfur carrier protein ThiS adenylyltransferase ThiF [candidate division CSSED10-310 bacterium]